MEWSPSNMKKLVAVGGVMSVFAIALTVALQSASEGAQAAAGIGIVVLAFIASMVATDRKTAQQRQRHRVAHIPLPQHSQQHAA